MSEFVLQVQNSPGAIGANLVAVFIDANTSAPAYVGNDGVVHSFSGSASGSNQQIVVNNAGAQGGFNTLLFDFTDANVPALKTRRGLFGDANGDLNSLAGDDLHWVTITNDPSTVSGGANAGLQLLRFNSYGNAGYGGNTHYCRYRGTPGAPSAIQSGDTFMSFGIRGYDGSGLSQSAGSFSAVATQTWNATAHGLKFVWQVTANGSTTRANGMELASTGLDVTGNVSANGVVLGTRDIQRNSQSANYTTVLADNGNQIYHPASDANARTFTIATNANVPYPLGAAITFVNRSASNVTVTTSDTLILSTGNTGSRTLGANAMCMALKTDTTEWMIT